jgi:hypothetical protein
MTISFESISFIIAGTGIAALFARAVVNATYYIEPNLRLDFFRFIPSLSTVSSAHDTRGFGFSFSFNTKTFSSLFSASCLTDGELCSVMVVFIICFGI